MLFGDSADISHNRGQGAAEAQGDGELAELFFEVGELLHGEAAEALVSHKGVARHDSGGRYPEVFEVIEDLIGSVAHAVEDYRLF